MRGIEMDDDDKGGADIIPERAEEFLKGNNSPRGCANPDDRQPRRVSGQRVDILNHFYSSLAR
ncbi:hypothetical protein [Methylocystis iwaonis]|nr:hypothetical protein [Methylocystis iwaonis]